MAVKVKNEGRVFSIDLAHNELVLADGDKLPITHIIGRVVVAGPTLSGQWITSRMANDEYIGIDAWREKYADRVN